MPTVRCEVREFGAASSFFGSIVLTMKKAGLSSAITPTGTSQIAFGPVVKNTNVVVKAIAGRLEKEGVAMDTANHRDAPASFRIWCGATVDQADVAALTGWLDWAYAEHKAQMAKAA